MRPKLWVPPAGPGLPLQRVLSALCAAGEGEGAVPPVRGAHLRRRAGPRPVQHTAARGPQARRLARGSGGLGAGDRGPGRLRGQLHSNGHQLPAYAVFGQDQPAPLRSSTPARAAAVASAAPPAGALSVQ